MIRSLAARALRGAFAVAAVAALSACATHEGFPRDRVKSVGLAVTCGQVLRRDYYDLAYRANSNHAAVAIPDWKLTDAARERVQAALPDASIGNLGVDPLKLIVIHMRWGSPFASAAERDLTPAFVGDADRYDFLIAIVPTVSDSGLAPYAGTGIYSFRGGTLFGTIDSKVGPLTAHAACRGLIFDRRNATMRSGSWVATEALPADIPPTTALEYYPPETLARFRDPLERVVRQSVDGIMPQLVADPKPAK